MGTNNTVITGYNRPRLININNNREIWCAIKRFPVLKGDQTKRDLGLKKRSPGHFLSKTVLPSDC